MAYNISVRKRFESNLQETLSLLSNFLFSKNEIQIQPLALSLTEIPPSLKKEIHQSLDYAKRQLLLQSGLNWRAAEQEWLVIKLYELFHLWTNVHELLLWLIYHHDHLGKQHLQGERLELERDWVTYPRFRASFQPLVEMIDTKCNWQSRSTLCIIFLSIVLVVFVLILFSLFFSSRKT